MSDATILTSTLAMFAAAPNDQLRPSRSQDRAMLPRYAQINDFLYKACPAALGTLSEDDLEAAERHIESLKSDLDTYLRASEGAWFFRQPILKLLRAEQSRLAEAIYAIRRGYSPGQLPPRETRRRVAETISVRTPTPSR
jgi:hypothetical protein